MAEGIREWSPASTFPAASAARDAIGRPGDGVELVRLGENAIYRLDGAPIVIRIAPSLDRLDDVAKEIRVARWLADAGLPAARLSDVSAPTPLVVLDTYPVTFWEYVEDRSPPPDYEDLGGLLRRLHGLEVPGWLELPAFTPFARVADRLGSAPAAARGEDVAFLRDLFARLQLEYSQLDFVFPPSAVHGDAHLGNLMRDGSGRALLIDFEAFAFGHREWDLAVTGARQAFDWVDEAGYRRFVDAYGWDVVEWPGFPVLRAIRELTMTTWLMQLVADAAAAEEFHRRVDDLREDRFPRRWRTF